MISKEFTILNKTGLHVRPAGTLVKIAQPFESSLKLKFNDKEYDAKSVLGIMSACIKCGDTVVFTANGSDEEAAMVAIEQGVNNKFGEAE